MLLLFQCNVVMQLNIPLGESLVNIMFPRNRIDRYCGSRFSCIAGAEDLQGAVETDRFRIAFRSIQKEIDPAIIDRGYMLDYVQQPC